MRTAIICGAAMALTVTAASAAEDDHSANYWLPRCKAFVEAREIGFRSSEERAARLTGLVCAGMVRGIWSGSALNGGVIRCVPDDVNTMQAVRVVVLYIEARLQRMHESFIKLTLEALMGAWPCKKCHRASADSFG